MSGEAAAGDMGVPSIARDVGGDLKRHLLVRSTQSATAFGRLIDLTEEKETIRNPVGEPNQHLNLPSSQALIDLETSTDRVPEKDHLKYPSMNIETPAIQPRAAGMRVVDDPSNHGVFKLEDFLAQHKAECDARQEAMQAAKNIAPKPTMLATPAAKKLKIAPDAKSLTPVAVGARTSKYTILLHETYQALGLPPPSFAYSGGSSQGWTVELSFPSLDIEALQGLKEDGFFNSKQEAKEAISKTALAIVEQMQAEGKIRKSGKERRAERGEQQEKVMKEPGPNYVGQLLEFQRATDSPQPTYTDYQSGARFACLISIDGHSDPFGSLTSLHSSKKAARQDAASHAVAHFKSIGTWPSDATLVGGIKKPKPTSGLPTTTTTNTPTIISTSTPGTPSKTASSTPNPNESFPSRVAQLATQLSLPCPEYIYAPHPSDPNFHTVACVFRDAGPHAGPLGEVRNVFGRKKAKDECARLVLAYLEEVKEKRIEYGREMMRGVGGGLAVGENALGRRVEGEVDFQDGKGKGRAVGGLVGGGGDEEGGEGFEDAVEMLSG